MLQIRSRGLVAAPLEEISDSRRAFLKYGNIIGVPLVFVGLLVGAWIGDFQDVGWVTIGILAALAALAWLVDFLAGAAGTRYVGATPRAFWGAALGAVVGMFFGLPGLLLGPFIGAVAGELSTGRGLTQSGRAGLGAWLGLVVATAAKLALVFLMLGIFLFAVFATTPG